MIVCIDTNVLLQARAKSHPYITAFCGDVLWVPCRGLFPTAS